MESPSNVEWLKGENMSVTLRLNHVDGLKLRQQSAHKITRTPDGQVVNGLEWKFEPPTDPVNETLMQDEDPRRRDSQGKPTKLGTYTVYITAGLKNLVVSKKGPIVSVDFKNSSLRNQMRTKVQKLDPKTKQWKDDGAPQYVPPNTAYGVFVGDNQRAILDEMPT
jgi:hypothetical protein